MQSTARDVSDALATDINRTLFSLVQQQLAVLDQQHGTHYCPAEDAFVPGENGRCVSVNFRDSKWCDSIKQIEGFSCFGEGRHPLTVLEYMLLCVYDSSKKGKQDAATGIKGCLNTMLVKVPAVLKSFTMFLHAAPEDSNVILRAQFVLQLALWCKSDVFSRVIMPHVFTQIPLQSSPALLTQPVASGPCHGVSVLQLMPGCYAEQINCLANDSHTIVEQVWRAYDSSGLSRPERKELLAPIVTSRDSSGVLWVVQVMKQLDVAGREEFCDWWTDKLTQVAPDVSSRLQGEVKDLFSDDPWSTRGNRQKTRSLPGTPKPVERPVGMAGSIQHRDGEREPLIAPSDPQPAGGCCNIL